MVVPHNMHLRLTRPSLQEAIGPEGPQGGERVSALVVAAANPIPRELPARR